MTLLGRSKAGGSAAHAWMVSLADLLALMLTFFVLLFSMNAVQHAHWRSVVASLRQQFNPHEARILPASDPDFRAVQQFEPATMDLDYLAEVLRHKLDGRSDWRQARMTRLADRLVLSLPTDLAFASGKAELSGTAERLLNSLGPQLRQLSNAVVVAGHSDPTPISRGAFASNWELSLRRAQSVAAVLEAAGYTRPIAVLGYGASRFGDLSDALDRKTRYRLGRRVDVMILAGDQAEAD